MSEAIIREARRDDCGHIARLFLISSDGLAEYIWSRMDMPGLTPVEIGERRYARQGVAFSYENCLMAEIEGRVIGMAHSFPMERSPDAPAEEPDPVLRPYAELEDYGSLYISGIALYPKRRGQGIGTRLLAATRDRAQRLGLDRLSLICFKGNAKAMRWYRRVGFTEIDRRPIVPHPMLHYRDGDAVLLVRPATPAF